MSKFYLFFFLVLTLFSCTEYTRIVKSDNYDLKFKLANTLFDKKNYFKSGILFEQVQQRKPKSIEGEISYFRLGKSNYLLEDYYMGAYYLGSFSNKYPESASCEEAAFLNVLCAVKNSPQFSLDQTETDLALNEMQLFIQTYPNSSRMDTCNLIMDKLRGKLELKEVETIRLYNKTLNYKSAIVTSESFIKDYPNSLFVSEIWEILLKNSFLITELSVEQKKNERIELSKERYRKFVLAFPNNDKKDFYKSKIEGLELLKNDLN